MTPSELIQQTVRAMDQLDIAQQYGTYGASLQERTKFLELQLRKIQQSCYHIYETVVPVDVTLESYERCGLCRQVFVKDRP